MCAYCMRAIMGRAGGLGRGSGSGQRNSLSREETSCLVPSFAYVSFHLSLLFFSLQPLLAKAHLSFHSEGEKIFGLMLKCQGKKLPVVRAETERASERSLNVSVTPLQVSIMDLIVLLLTYGVWEDLIGNSLTIPVATFQTNSLPHAMTSCKQCD